MNNDDRQPEPRPAASVPPTRPPCGAVVGAGAGEGDSSGRMEAPDYGCHEALWALVARYREADIQDAHSALVEQEKLLREHIHFPSYKMQLAQTMILRSDIVSHLGNAEAASSIMAEAFSVMADALRISQKQLVASPLLETIRKLDKNVRWRRSDPAA